MSSNEQLDALRSQPREWHRGTELISLFVATGYGRLRLEQGETRAKPASLLLVGDPGHGKTELLERFRPNRALAYKSDITSRGLWEVLRAAKHRMVTHVVATEFQKWFQRKQSVAENTLGIIVQAMEEGVYVMNIGGREMDFSGARFGIIGGVTHGTLQKRREFFSEMGFLSRAAVIPWELPLSEKKIILTMQDHGIMDDVMPVSLILPEEVLPVDMAPEVSQLIHKYAWATWKEHVLRVYGRLRALSMSAAILDGRDIVTASDVDRVLQFDDYWKNMVLD